MSDLSEQRLHEVISPVFEVWPELRPEGLNWRRDQWHCIRPNRCSFWLDAPSATALCRDAMVEGLRDRGACPTLCNGMSAKFDGECVVVKCYIRAEGEKSSFYELTTVEALASACVAVKKEITDG